MNISTLARNEFLRTQMLDVQRKMAKTQDQISSGMKSSVYSGLGLDARASLNLNNVKQTTEAYVANINTTTPRMKIAEQAIGRIFDIAVEMRSKAVGATTEAGLPLATGNGALKSLARLRLHEVISLLNTQVDGMYLFAGQDTGAPPMTNAGKVGDAGTPLDNVALIDLTDPLDNTDPTTSGADRYAAITAHLDAPGVGIGEYYYEGDTSVGTTLTARIDEGFDLDYGIRADNTNIKSILRSLYAMATTDLTPTTEAGFRQVAGQAEVDLDTGLRGLNIARADLGVQQQIMQEMSTRHDNFLTLVKIQIGQVQDQDMAEAIGRFNLLQTNLQTSFQVMASLRDLTLVNFL
jgi:flagellar hook-associated protein 3 FlgL